MEIIKRLKALKIRLSDFFHVHKWEYDQNHFQTIRRCKCGEAHVNKHMVSQIYGGEHWYEYND